jgi:hypothetical protein
MQVSGKLHALAALTPRKNPSTRLVEGWVRPIVGMENISLVILPGFRSRTFHPVDSRYADYVVPAPSFVDY